MTYFDDHQAAYTAELVEAYAVGETDGDGIGLQVGDADSLDPNVLGYGTDLACGIDVAEDFHDVDPASPEAVGQSATRFLLGGGRFRDDDWNARLGDDSDAAFDLYGMLSQSITDKQLIAAVGIARTLLAQQDDRIATVELTAEYLGGGRFQVRLGLTLNSGGFWSNVFVLTSERLPQ